LLIFQSNSIIGDNFWMLGDTGEGIGSLFSFLSNSNKCIEVNGSPFNFLSESKKSGSEHLIFFEGQLSKSLTALDSTI
jgi:hypothetical protein